MFMEERRLLIIDYLSEHDRATVQQLAHNFNVTKETIRSDLRALSEKGMVQRCHGGATIIRRSLQSRLIAETNNDFDVLLKSIKRNDNEKGT